MTPADAAAIGFRHFHDQLAQLKQRLLDMSDLADVAARPLGRRAA